MKRVSITHMNNRHNEWLRSLEFYKQEITILKERLTEIAGKNTATEVSKDIDHYENQFKVQVDNIDKLLHDTRQNISDAGKQANASGAGYIDGRLIQQHDVLEQAFNVEETVINNLRHNFNIFAASWM